MSLMKLRYDFYSYFYKYIIKIVRKNRSKIWNKIPCKSGDKVYMPGCGPGSDFKYLASDIDIFGLDISSKMLAQAKKEALLYKHNFSFEMKEIGTSNLENNFVDLVILHFVLAVVVRPDAALAEALRVLKPGGYISIVDKFILKNTKFILLRNLLNPCFNFLGTNINLKIEPLLEQFDLKIVDSSSFFYGQIQWFLLQKK